MKKTILRSALYSSLLIAALSFSSCGKKESTDSATDTETMETETTETENTDPVMDTVVEKDGDTIVKTGGGENSTPTADQVP